MEKSKAPRLTGITGAVIEGQEAIDQYLQTEREQVVGRIATSGVLGHIMALLRLRRMEASVNETGVADTATVVEPTPEDALKAVRSL